MEKIKLRVLRNAHSKFSTFTHFYHLLWCYRIIISFSFPQSFNSYLSFFFSHIIETTRNNTIFESRAHSPELSERPANKWSYHQKYLTRVEQIVTGEDEAANNNDGWFWAGVLLLIPILDFIEYFRWRSTTPPRCRGSRKNSSPSVSSQLLNKYERICYVIITVPLYNPLSILKVFHFDRGFSFTIFLKSHKITSWAGFLQISIQNLRFKI